MLLPCLYQQCALRQAYNINFLVSEAVIFCRIQWISWRFQKNAARTSCIQKHLFLWNSDGINKYQYALHTNNCRCKRAFLHGSVALLRFGLISGIPRLHSHTPYLVGSLWPRDRPVPDISTWQYTTLPRHTSMPRRDSKVQTQQASGHGPSP